MQSGAPYQVGKDHTGSLEKKNAIGMWGKKYVVLTGLKFSICDQEGGAATQSFELQSVVQAENGDPLLLTLKGPTDSVTLRSDRSTVDYWYDLCRTALEVHGKAKPRSFGLPAVDPRFNLKFIEIPVEYRHRFASLESAVIYWFSPIKKYGTASKITGKFSVEERVAFVGDKAFYVTKPNSEVTRCMKIASMKALCTNLNTKKAGDELFVVIKMESPDYDLYFACPEVESLVSVLQTLFRAVTKGRELPVRSVNAPTEAAVELQLNRPEGFSMAMVVPTTKGPLKKALDEYAAKHGIQLTSTGTAAKAKKETTAKRSARAPTPKEGAKDDLLVKFMKAVNLPQLADLLKKQMVDFDVLQVMEEDDYVNFGIPPHQAKIVKEKISDSDFVASLTSNGSFTSNTSAKAPITLDDDDDDFGILTSPGTAASAAPPISFDDLDDFDIALPSKASFVMKVVLDSDDDLDLPPPKPKLASPPKGPVDLDLDDI